MEPTFRWRKLRVHTSEVNRGKMAFVAMVPTTGFAIECHVMPNSNGQSYDWAFFPRVLVGSTNSIHLYEQQVNRFGAFVEPLDAVAELENIVQGEISNSLAGKPSVFDLWWPAIVSALRGEQRVW